MKVRVLVALGVLFAACGPNDTGASTGDVHALVTPGSASLPVTVNSADGRRVTVRDTRRIIPLWDNIAEVVFALGLGDHVVARDTSTTFAQARKLPLVTRAHDVTAESVLSLRPTLILADEQSGPPEALRQIRDIGVPVVVFRRPTNVEEIPAQIRRIATALGVKKAGVELADKATADIDAVREGLPSNARKPRVAFLYIRGNAGVSLIAGPGSGVDSMIKAAGGSDAGTAIHLANPFTPLTSEALVKAQPDVILMTTTGLKSVGGVNGLLDVPGVAQTPAGRDRRIVTMEDGLLFSFGTRTAHALRTLSAEFYKSASSKAP
jgi:iron complex transport system substrate-binding protein